MCKTPVFLPRNNNLWHQVKITPEYTKMPVLSRGKASHCMVNISAGGQIPPIKIDGQRVKWKKAQKKEKKNIISEAINSFIPNKILSWTLKVWLPSKVASVTISESHRDRVRQSKTKEISKVFHPFSS